MNTELLNTDRTSMDGLPDLLISNGVNDKECDKFMEYLVTEEFDEDSIYYDVVYATNDYENSNLFNQLKIWKNAIDLIKLIENHLNLTFEDETNKLRLQLIECMAQTEFTEFVIKTLNDESHQINSNHDVLKEDIISAFKQYCKENDISGKLFLQMPQQVMIHWMSQHCNIDTAVSTELFDIIKAHIEKYNHSILQIIESTTKQRTQKFDKPYYLKLFHYFS
eukprot:361277_1